MHFAAMNVRAVNTLKKHTRKGQITMKKDETLYITIPAYNEEANLARLIDEWYPVIERFNGNGNSRLVIVNDGSTDSTLSLLNEKATDRPYMKVLDKKNGGHGSAVLAGYRYAIRHKAGYIFQTDSDGQTNPDEFEAFWILRKKYDAIIGMRPDREDGASRKFVEGVLLFILWLVFGIKVPDSNAPFRLMKRELVERYIQKLPKDFPLPNVMLTTYFAYFKENITFRHISFCPRQAGKNSINVRRILKIGIYAVRDFILLRKDINK